MFSNVGSINDGKINVKKCASRNGLKLRSANTARSMRVNTAVLDRGRRGGGGGLIKAIFDPWQGGALFSRP